MSPECYTNINSSVWGEILLSLPIFYLVLLYFPITSSCQTLKLSKLAAENFSPYLPEADDWKYANLLRNINCHVPKRSADEEATLPASLCKATKIIFLGHPVAA